MSGSERTYQEFLAQKNRSQLSHIATEKANNSYLFHDTEIEGIDYSENVAISPTGTELVFAGWYTSELIDISGYPSFYYQAPYFNSGGTKFNALSLYDESENFLGYVSSDVVTSGLTILNGVHVVQEDEKYVRLTYFNSGGDTSDNKIMIKSSTADTKGLNKLKGGALLKVDLVGDSLTEGDYGSEPAGTENVSEINYPHFFREYLECYVRNMGYCGYSATAYWTVLSANNYLEGEKAPNVAVIMLGTNGGLTDTLASDVEPYSDYNDYANTNTGNYCKIIEHYNEKMGGVGQIFLCTCPYVNPDTRPTNATYIASANDVIPKIAERYNLPIIDVFSDLGLSFMNTDVMQPIDGLHFGVSGYERLGMFIASQVKSKLAYLYGL